MEGRSGLFPIGVLVTFQGEVVKVGEGNLDFTIDERFSRQKFVSNEKHLRNFGDICCNIAEMVLGLKSLGRERQHHHIS